MEYQGLVVDDTDLDTCLELVRRNGLHLGYRRHRHLRDFVISCVFLQHVTAQNTVESYDCR